MSCTYCAYMMQLLVAFCNSFGQTWINNSEQRGLIKQTYDVKNVLNVMK